MAENQQRTRRSQRAAQTPDRVSEAAQRMQQTGRGFLPPQGENGTYGPGPGGPQNPNGWTQQQYEQQMLYQQQMYQQQMYQRQLYEQQQYAMAQEQERKRRQQQERERISTQTSSYGAFRGYTGEIPVPEKKPGEQVPPPKRHRAGLIAVLVILSAVLVAGGVLGIQQYQKYRTIHEAVTAYDNLFAEGVYVDGIHLGGMTWEQGLNSVESRIRQRNDAWNVTLSWQGTALAEITADMLGMEVDVQDTMERAWAQGHTGDEETRYAAMAALREKPFEAYTAAPSGDTSVIDSVLAQVKEQIDRQAVNARLISFDTTLSYPFVFQEEVEGRVLDIDEVRQELYHKVATMTSGTVELHPEIIEPESRLEDIKRHCMLRSSVYTPISTSSDENRNNNIRRAFEAINGYVISPGSQFSFNTVVGQRTEANGFFPAIEYAYGEHTMGIGGGVCQASTTVYQAAVCAGLRIVDRRPHSDAVNYTEYGKDATVYWEGKRKIDLVLRNNTDQPIYIVAAVQKDPGNRRRLIAKVMMYGEDMGDVRYEIACKTVREIDPPEKPKYIQDTEGTYVKYTHQEKSVSKAKPGYVVESYRVKYEGNTEVERVLLYTDTYDPQPEKIYVGVTKRQ